IGESKATAIIEYREKEGLFPTIEALKSVSGIGEKTVEKVKEYLDVNE
ncbi:helix-hairpin-helix domain-containing protein, partial [Listeria monocytogenes]|nr:helix-hairpin-helix domain-containing protein [Listeria monocytogenes]